MPGPLALQGHQLVAHVVLSIGRPADYAVALGLWGRAVAEFALPDPIVPHPHDLPADPPPVADGESLLAARSGRAPGTHQIVARRVHDVLCVSLVCAPAGATGWADLDERWRRVRDTPSPSVLGSVRILQARLFDPGAGLDDVDPAALFEPDLRRRWIGGVVEPEPRLGALAVWEDLDDDADQAALDGRRDRGLVVLAPADRDGELSAFTWSRGGRALTHFGHYLLHATKLRHAVRTRSATVRALPRLRASVDRARAELAPLVGAGQALGGAAGAAARAALAELAAADLGLATRHGLLTELRTSVEAAETNMGNYAGRDRSAEPFADDRAVATWLHEQIGQDLGHVEGPRSLLRDLVAAVTPLVPDRASHDETPTSRLPDRPVAGATVQSLTPPQRRILSEDLLSAYPRYELLEMMFANRLGRSLPLYSQQDRLDVVMHRVIGAADSEGWLAELVTQALLGNPGNPQLRAQVEGGLLDLDSAVSAAVDSEIGGLAEVRLPPEAFVDRDHDYLEHVVREVDGFHNPLPFWAGLEAGIRRVCLVDTPDLAAERGGTGFLVGPDLVLTNHHVLADVIAGGAGAANVRCVFDHAVGPNGAIDDSIRMRLAQDWLVVASPPSVVDRRPGSAGLPALDELDYALVRLNGPVPGAPARSWYDLLADPPPLRPGRTLLVLQHPDGMRLKMAFGPVLAVNDNHTRLTHHVNTASGSSGGPCLTLDMRLAALHQAGSPRNPADARAAKVNVAVPIEAITRHLIDSGLADLLPAATG